MDKYIKERQEIRQLYKSKDLQPLKYAALAAIGIAIILMLVMIIWMDSIPLRAMLIMRGCAGVLGLVFLMICGILAYRVHSRHISSKYGNGRRK